MNAGRKPVISTHKNKEMGKRHSIEQITQDIWLSQRIPAGVSDFQLHLHHYWK